MNPTVKERPAEAGQVKRSLEKERERLFAKLQEINQAIQETEADNEKSGMITLAQLRASLGWSRNQLAHVMNASDRAIVNWEQGDPISAVYAAKLREIQSVYNELKQLMKPEEIGSWLLAGMEEFEGRTPADLSAKARLAAFGRRCFTSDLGCPTKLHRQTQRELLRERGHKTKPHKLRNLRDHKCALVN